MKNKRKSVQSFLEICVIKRVKRDFQSSLKEISEKVFKKVFLDWGGGGEKVFERMPSIVWHYRLIPLKCLVFYKMIVNHLTSK